MATKQKAQIIAMSAPVAIQAAETEGEQKSPPKFSVVAYTGGVLEGALRFSDGRHEDVVQDLAGMEMGKSLIANLDHEVPQRVGHIVDAMNDGKQVVLNGVASAATSARDVVVNSAADGFTWQASIEANPKQLEFVKAKQTVQVNGQTFTGPLYVARKSVLKGFAFVSHGADDNTSASIAASAASPKEKKMDSKLREWIEAMLPGTDVDSLSEDAIANLEANYNGQSKKKDPPKGGDSLESKKIEAERRKDIKTLAEEWCDQAMEAGRYDDIEVIRAARDEAITAGTSVSDFKYEVKLATLTNAPPTIHASNGKKITGKVLEAAVCMAGRLEGHEEKFDEQTLEAAHDNFRHGIGLKELLVTAARANGYRGNGYHVDREVLETAFAGPKNRIHAAQGFSTFSLPNTLSNVANKFIREGFMHVDQAWRQVSVVRPVSDFKQTTTISLTGDFIFKQLGKQGEIEHGVVGEEVYTNQADTYARMFAVSRKDIINDDLGALTAVPRRLGRGGALLLNSIFWTEFLDNASFFTTALGNEIEDDAVLGLSGLNHAYTTFMDQTDPDGNPLGSMPKILLVPTALEATARQLMSSEKLKGDLDEPDANVWRGRFDVVTSPYLSSANISGSSSIAWYLMADPNDLPVMEVAALNGRVEPTVDTAEADFNTLGIQMRGYCDVGCSKQERRGAVRADGTET